MSQATIQQLQSWASTAGFSTTKTVAGTPGYTQLEVIVAIAQAESGGDTQVVNPRDPNGGSFGVLQINGFWFSHGFSKAQALDPQQSFSFAFNVISHHGTNFNDWGTFTSGAYEAHIKTAAQAQRGLIKLPAHGWWQFSHPNDLGQPDRFGGFPKPDINVYGLPGNYPIAAILSGTVTSVSASDPWGGTVTIRLDSPINHLATHFAFLHLSQINTAKGKHVSPGDVIGHAGSRPLGSQNAAFGVALYPGDAYGHGTEWSQMTKSNILGPLNVWNVIEAADKGTLTEGAPGVGSGITSAGGSTPGGPGGPSVNPFSLQLNNDFLAKSLSKVQQNNPLSPDASVSEVLQALDTIMQYENPFQAFGSSGNFFNDLGTFINALFVIDTTAWVLRVICLLLGVYMIFKVVNSWINITGMAGNALQLAGSIAAFA